MSQRQAQTELQPLWLAAFDAEGQRSSLSDRVRAPETWFAIEHSAGTNEAGDGVYRVVPRNIRELVINESAARQFDLGTPTEAVGKQLLPPPLPARFASLPQFASLPPIPPSTVVAVVPDFSMGSVSEAIKPMVFFQPTHETNEPQADVLSVRLKRQHILTSAAAERRTKGIGIRKALGADTEDVFKLLLWQFARPVVWANLIAWPAAGYLMQRWLSGFAYHIELPLWLFPATALATVLIALGTVSAHALRVARSTPVTALRYE